LNNLVGALAAAAAKDLVGTRFQHCGRSRAGVDCVGVVVLAYQSIGAEIKDFQNYSRQAVLNDSEVLASKITEQFEPGSRANLLLGDLLLFSMRGVRTHVGIYVGENQFVHAYEGSINKVILDRLTPSWRARLIGAFTLR
jgi:cell wall-associated NlpC family hydrolase